MIPNSFWLGLEAGIGIIGIAVGSGSQDLIDTR